MESSGSGIKKIISANTTMMENGRENKTITNYTFIVPPVPGHYGSDWGRIKGYNLETNEWEQLDFGRTSNGITFTKQLTAGKYSELEFHYYTNHRCMFNKSHIFYEVDYH